MLSLHDVALDYVELVPVTVTSLRHKHGEFVSLKQQPMKVVRSVTGLN